MKAVTIFNLPAAATEDQIRDIFNKIRKNIDQLGDEIYSPKYIKAFTRLKEKAQKMAKEYYETSLFMMPTLPSSENDKLFKLRMEIYRQHKLSLSEAIARGDVNGIINLACQAHERDLENWEKVYHSVKGNDLTEENGFYTYKSTVEGGAK